MSFGLGSMCSRRETAAAGLPEALIVLSHRCGDCVERIIRLIGVANYGKSHRVNGVREIRSREWREIYHVPPMSYG